MKIAVVALRFPEISETFVLHHVAGLLAAGHDVDVYSTLDPVSQIEHPAVRDLALTERTVYLGVPRVRHRLAALPRGVREMGGVGALRWFNPMQYGLGVLSLKSVFSLPALAAAQRDRAPRYDVVHCHFGTQGYAYLFLREYFRAPLVTSFHGFDLVCFGRFGRLAYRRLFRDGDAFVANSDSTRRRLERLGCPGGKITVVPSIVDDVDVVPRTTVLERGPARLLTVARLDEAKGVQYALEAVRLLRDAGYAVEYDIVGDGPYRARLEALARALGVAEYVRFAGWQAKAGVYGAYRAADIFVLPSVRSRRGGEETQGVVIQEAQLHGVPVVGTAIGGIPESVDHGRAGLLCAPGDASDLARCIRTLCDDPAAARLMGAAGMHYCRASRSKQGLIARLEALYDSLVVPNETRRGTSDRAAPDVLAS